MSRFFAAVPVEEAITAALTLARPPTMELVSIQSAYGRILASEIHADMDIPGFNRSSVDGFAVRSHDTAGAMESLPAMLILEGRVSMGGREITELRSDRCFYVPTGGKVPDGADAVVMVEYTEVIGDHILVKRPVAPGENMVMRGEDFRAGEVVLQKGTLLSPRGIAALAAVGIEHVEVTKRPRIGVISTGNELVPVGEIPDGSKVRDINTWMCGALLQEAGCIPTYYGITPDDRSLLRQAIEKAGFECDAVLISGGSSKDDRDMTADLIRESGEVLVHGIALSPGKPTIIGRTGHCPVIGLPGHPASAFVVLLVIARPLLQAMTGQRDYAMPAIRLELGQNIPSARGREDYIRVSRRGGKVYPEFGKSGLVNTLIRSDGLVRVPSGVEGLEEGEEVEVILW